MFCGMNFKKRIKLVFNNPHNPNESMGEIFSFNTKSGDVVAHLSLTWDARLWFAYADGKGEWHNHYFPMFFNTYTRGIEPNIVIDFCFDGKRVIWSQNDFVHTFSLPERIFFQYVAEFPASKSELYDLIKNRVIMSESRLVEQRSENPPKTVDIIVCAYKASHWLELSMNTLCMTYGQAKQRNFDLKQIILIDNNPLEEETLKVKKIAEQVRKDYGVDVLYQKNEDERYVSNRPTAVVLGIQLSTADIILNIDSDTVFTGSEWLTTFDHYIEFPSIVGASSFYHAANTKRIRNASFLCPRTTPHFVHFRADYLKKKVKTVPDLFDDLDLSFKYKNVNIGIVGFHFSKLFLEVFSDHERFMVLDKWPSYFVHAKARSFEEVHRKTMIHQRISVVDEAILKRVTNPELLKYIEEKTSMMMEDA